MVSYVTSIASVNLFEVYGEIKNEKEVNTKKKIEGCSFLNYLFHMLWFLIQIEIVERCLEKANSIDNIIFKVEVWLFVCFRLLWE